MQNNLTSSFRSARVNTLVPHEDPGVTTGRKIFITIINTTSTTTNATT